MPQFIRVFFNNFKEYIILILLLVISLLLITVNENHKVKNVRLYALGTFASVNSIFSNLLNYFENTEYSERLLKHNAELMLEVNKLRNYAYEYDELKSQLLFKDSSDYSLVSAKVVSRLVSKVSGYFIISKGSIDSIYVGMPVITDKGLVGIVTDVATKFSTVRTYENSLFKLAVKDQRSNVNGILNWDGKNLIIKNIPTTDDVEVGDRVVVSELSTLIPPTIPIGIISTKESTISGLLSNIKIKPFTNLDEIKNVLIINKTENTQIDSLLHRIIGVKN